MNTFTKGLFAFVALLSLASCGGGGSDVAGGGIGGTGISQGPITGFGSVFVNGIEFRTTGAEIEIEDKLNQSEDKLGTGMVVRVEWEKDASGKYTAKRIKYADDVQGPVESKSLTTAGGTFTVLGQIIKVDALTVFSGTADFAGLQLSQIVEVSGLRYANGDIRATRVEIKLGTTEVELKGVVSNLSNSQTFTIVGTTVNYSSLFGVINGACVEVKGTASGNMITAISIESDDSCSLGGVKDGEDVEIEGFVTGLSGDTFNVNGVAVSVASMPDSGYENGTKASLNDNVRVEVEGKITNGVLIAQKVKFKLGGDDGSSDGGSGIVFDEIKGRVISVERPNSLSVFNGERTVSVSVNNDSLFEDGIRRDLGNVMIEDFLSIKFHTKNGANIAIKVEREEDD